jgi:ATP-binding cassette, subfamily B, heavy metal transporter
LPFLREKFLRVYWIISEDMVRKKIEEINFKKNFGVYWSFLKKYKYLAIFVVLLVVVSEATHLIPKLLLKEIIDKGNEFSSGSLGYDLFLSVLIMSAVIYFVTITFRAVSDWARIHYLNKIEVKLMFDLKNWYFNHISKLSHNFHTTHKTGSLISRLIRGSGAMERMTDVLVFNIAPLVIQVIIVGASIIYFDWKPFVALVATVFVFITYSLYWQNKQRPYQAIANRNEDLEKGFISDVFTNIDTVKYYGKEDRVKGRYKRKARKSMDSLRKFFNFGRWMGSGQSLIVAVGSFFMIYFPLVSFLNGEISIGTVVFIYSIYGNLVGPMFSFIHGIRGYYRSMIDFDSLFEYGYIENEIKDKQNAISKPVKKGEIEFKNVEFNYGKRKIFKNFNLKINKDEKVAFVGHSGSGKTTLVKLLYRLYDVQSGEIIIDGINIKDYKQEFLRGELSIVPQEAILFDDTVYNNVKFSNVYSSDKEIKDAIKFAQLDKVIKDFPKKENTIVGERGVKLSGGEKQRVSIARAILANKQVLVLDEATSALDSKTEHEIQKDLARLMEGRTSIIIAHRLSTIMSADKIVVMDKGKIVQIGKHSDLIRQKGTYRELWNLQKGGYIAE